MRLLNLFKGIFRAQVRPARTSDGIALGYGIEKFDVVPGASRRLAAHRAHVAAASMTADEREAHVQVFGTPAEKELMTAIRKQQRAD